MARRSVVTITVDLRGLRGFVDGRMKPAAGRGIRLATLDLLGESAERAPVKEGPLRGSGTAHFDGRVVGKGPPAGGATPLAGAGGSDDLTGVVVFNAIYAAYQHEGVEFHHPKGGEAKYLERPANQNRAQYLALIAREAQKATQGRDR